LCHEHKTEYAIPIANKLINEAEPDKKIPPQIKNLFYALSEKIGILEVPNAEDTK
jgi:hypothetical protein